jgi:hypothetical protein
MKRGSENTGSSMGAVAGDAKVSTSNSGGDTGVIITGVVKDTVETMSEGGRATRIIISGGGTGGHLFPAIAIANALRRLEPGE